MEVLLTQFTIDDAIDVQWTSTKSRQENIQRDRQVAEETAINALTKQFENELNGCLDNACKGALGIKVIAPKELSALAVMAVFEYSNIQFLLMREYDTWQLAFNGKKISCSADILQKTILIELGKIKNAQANAG